MKSLGFTRSVVTRSLCRASSRYRFSVPAASASCLRPPSVALGLSGFAATLAAASTAFLHCAAAEEEQATPATAEEADRMFTANEYSSLAALLRAALAERPDDDAELLWRLGRACKKLADEEKPKSPAKQALIREGVASTERALALRPSCGQAHKWHAILLLEVGQFEGTTATIKNSFVVREHFERAVELSPTDATARHLLGLWCFEVAKLSWLEQKAAAALFAAPPKASFEEAVGHFAAAEEMDPGFYPKNLLLLSMAHAKLGHKAEAAAFRQRCLAAPALTPEDEQTHRDAQKFAP